MNRLMQNLLVAFSILTVTAVYSAEPGDIIKYRQNVMKAIGGHTGASASIIQGKVDYKSSLMDHALGIQAMTKDIPSLFPKGSDMGETAALESVWKKRTEFEKAAADTKKAADAFAAAVKKGDKAGIGTAFSNLGESCKACHKEFRKKQN
jgi:cytochrome c556